MCDMAHLSLESRHRQTRPEFSGKLHFAREKALKSFSLSNTHLWKASFFSDFGFEKAVIGKKATSVVFSASPFSFEHAHLGFSRCRDNFMVDFTRCRREMIAQYTRCRREMMDVFTRCRSFEHGEKAPPD